jgi:hypothetical protein
VAVVYNPDGEVVVVVGEAGEEEVAAADGGPQVRVGAAAEGAKAGMAAPSGSK